MSETAVLDDETTVPLADLVAASGLPLELVGELVEWGAFEPVAGAAVMFRSRTIVMARRAARLRSAFTLDAAALALALAYLERIDALERRLRELECSQPR
ncbi:MAG: chaperone modulator CbpM [Burkholderiaceae bacterium]